MERWAVLFLFVALVVCIYASDDGDVEIVSYEGCVHTCAEGHSFCDAGCAALDEPGEPVHKKEDNECMKKCDDQHKKCYKEDCLKLKKAEDADGDSDHEDGDSDGDE